MKKLSLKLALVFAIAISFMACSKDEETTSPSLIVGKWEGTTAMFKVTNNGQILENNIDTFVTGQFIIDFLSNGLMISTSSDTTAVSDDTSSYVVNGNTLTLISLDKTDTGIYNISTLSATNLKLIESQTEVQNGNTIVSEYSVNFIKK